jgi:hypothetical protein
VRHFRIVALLAVTPACLIESRNVNIGQVPRANIPFATAAPTSGVAELTAGASSLPSVANAKSTNRGSGAEVPKVQGRAEARIRVTDALFIGGVYEHGFGHQQVDESLPALRSGNVSGFGLMFGGTITPNESSPWRIGWTANAMRWTVPYDQYSTVTVSALGFVTGVSQFQSSSSDTTETLGFGLWPSYAFGQLRLFGGGYATQLAASVRLGERRRPANSLAGPVMRSWPSRLSLCRRLCRSPRRAP